MATGQQQIGKSQTRGLLWRYLPLGILAVAAIALFSTGLHRSLSFESFVEYQSYLQQMVADNLLKMLGVYAAVYVASVTLSLPVSAFLTTIGGFLFGWALGGAVASMSATLGATSIFLIAKSSLGKSLLRRAGTRIQGLAAGFQRQAFSYLLFLRLMPLVPFWLTNLAAAFFGLRLRTYVLATQIGMLPASFAFAFAGSGLDEVIATQKRIREECLAKGGADCALQLEVRNLLTPQLTTALVLLGLLALAPILVKLWQRWQTGGARDQGG